MSDYAFEGPTWSGSVITWSFAPAGGTFTNSIGTAYQSTIEAAIARWAQVTNLTFKEVADSAASDIRIGWGSFNGSEIGETDYSYHTQTNTFAAGTTVRLEDPSLDFVAPTSGAMYAGTSTTLYQVTLHEFGHALGLAHSTDPGSIMYPTLGAGNTDLDSSDIHGVQAMYGAVATPAITTTTTSAVPAATPALIPSAIPLGNGIAVYRFFDSSSGTQFLTGSLDERNSLIATRPDLRYEGLGMGGVANGSADPNAVSVYRFFDTGNGTHFFTSNANEAGTIAATRPDLVAEGASFMEHATAEAGDVAVYRFFNSGNGTHFFTNSANEQASLMSTRPDMQYEGIAFYAPTS